MAREGLDALVASSPENVLYATDYECSSHWINKGFQVYAVLSPGRSPDASIVAPSLELEALVDGDVWVRDVHLFAPFARAPAPPDRMDAVGRAAKALAERAHPARSAADGLVAAIEARGLERGRIGLDESGMSPLHWREIERRLPGAELVPAGSLWWEIRIVKTAEEVRRLREASRIAELACREAFRLIRPGVRERAVVDEYHRQLATYGARPTFTMLGSGTRTSHPHILESDKEIADGDLVRVDIGCTYRFYHADTARVVSLGRPKDEHRRIYEALVEGVADGLAAIRPGAEVRDVYEAAMRPPRALGLAGFDRFHCGHGIGLSVYDPPVVTASDPAASAFLMPAPEGGLEVGTALNVEVGYYVGGLHGFLFEETVVVTEDGFERLTRASRAMPLDRFLGEDGP